MKYFPTQRMDHGSKLFDSASITSDPLREKMDAIKRMKKSRGVSKIFVPSLPAADIELHQNQNKEICT